MNLKKTLILYGLGLVAYGALSLQVSFPKTEIIQNPIKQSNKEIKDAYFSLTSSNREAIEKDKSRYVSSREYIDFLRKTNKEVPLYNCLFSMQDYPIIGLDKKQAEEYAKFKGARLPKLEECLGEEIAQFTEEGVYSPKIKNKFQSECGMAFRIIHKDEK